jgi:hypothetical protein
MRAGRPPKEKSFSNMLNIALAVKEADGETTKLRAIAEKLVEMALRGESWAIKEVADRIDGKPAQALDISGAIDTSPNRLSDEELEAIVVAQQNHQEGKTIN